MKPNRLVVSLEKPERQAGPRLQFAPKKIRLSKARQGGASWEGTVGTAAYPSIELDGVRIVDEEAGVAYEIALDERSPRPELLHLGIYPLHGQNFAGLGSRLDESTLATLGAAWMQRGRDDDAKRRGEGGTSRLVDSVPKARGYRPDVATIARVARDARSRNVGAEGVLAEAYSVSKHTARDWLKLARQSGALPSTGRGRKPRTIEEQS
jgi:hypothetical protein